MIVRADFVREPARLFVGADIVVFSGSLNTLRDEEFYSTIRLAYDAAGEALAFNFLCSDFLAGREYLFWRRREDVLKFAGEFCADVRVKDDYLQRRLHGLFDASRTMAAIVRMFMLSGVTGRIDVHSHLLPAVDDGCQTVEDSLACARCWSRRDIRTVSARRTSGRICRTISGRSSPRTWPGFRRSFGRTSNSPPSASRRRIEHDRRDGLARIRRGDDLRPVIKRTC